MFEMTRRGLVLLSLALVMLIAAPTVDAAMKITSATIPMPTDDKAIKLASLWYGVEWKTEITSIRLERDTEGGDPLRPIWVVTGSSSRPQIQKVILQITLLDEAGKPVGSVKKFLILKVGSVNEEYKVKMKVKAAAWERATQVTIRATFTVA